MSGQPGFGKDTNNGKVLLSIENGAVVFGGSTESNATAASIKSGGHANIFVNGEQVGGEASVRYGDVIELKVEEDIVPEKLEIRVSGDGMKAEALYKPGIRRYYIIAEHPFTDHLIVDAVPHEEQVIALTPNLFIEELQNKKITFGIDYSALPLLIEEPEEWHTVASGLPARQGTHGTVEPQFEGGIKSIAYGEDESKVDYRKRYEIEHVNKGDLLAKIFPPIQGEPGKTVTGDNVAPDQVKAVEVRCDHGAELNADNSEVRAVRKGVPSYKKGKVHIFRVDDIYSHKGDVDIKSGNIFFHGHLKIEGIVAEGMQASADGDIEISENVSGARIMAGGSIILKSNCIKCVVQAGWVDIILKDIYQILKGMNESLGSAVQASEEVAQALEKKGKHSEQMEAAVVRALLQSKFTELPRLSAELLKKLREAGRSLPEDLAQLIKDVAPQFIDFQYSQALCRPTLVQIEHKVSHCLETWDSKPVKADIKAPYVQNSELSCTGDIVVDGSGVYNSRLKCSGSVNISRLFRGGSIEAGGDVFIGEAGAPRITADQGLIQLSYKGRAHLGAVYENVRFKFGSTEYRCEKNLQNVRLMLDQEAFEVKILHWEK